MKVLVAGATSVPGVPILRELQAKGHKVIGITRSPSKTNLIEATGAQAIVADVLDRDQIHRVVAEVAPDAVISLLTTLPKYGPKRYRDFKPATRLWRDGAGNLVAAAQAAGVQRIVAESVIFSYGYGRYDTMVDESTPATGRVPAAAAVEAIAALRGMEQRVLTSSATSRTEGILLRYGAIHGPDIPTTRLVVTMMKFFMMAVPGDGLLSWIHIDDVASGTVAALERGQGGEIYNLVDDRPIELREYLNAVAKALHRPKPPRVPLRLFSISAPYAAQFLGYVRLPVSNAKAKRELGWTPAYPDPLDGIASFTPSKPAQASC